METEKLSTQQHQKKGVKTENKDFLEVNENEYVAYLHLWDKKEAVPRGKLTALRTYI